MKLTKIEPKFIKKHNIIEVREERLGHYLYVLEQANFIKNIHNFKTNNIGPRLWW